MNGRKTTRIALDAALTIMIAAEMFIQYTGQFLHEVIGFAFFATIAVHLALSAKWIKSTAGVAKRGKMTGRRTALAVMGILLAVDTLVLATSSIAISGLLADAGFVWTLGSYALWVTVHSVSSYALCALVAVHLGMHWVFLASALRVPYDPSRRRAIGAGVHVVAAMGALALGIMAVNEALPRTASANPADPLEDETFNGAVEDVRHKPDSSTGTDSQKKSKRKGKLKKDSPETSVQENESAPTQEAEESPIEEPVVEEYAEEYTEEYSEPSYEESFGEEDFSDMSGFCTLCHKSCPLSAPQCDRPYSAGLI